MSYKPESLKSILAYTGKVLPIITEDLTPDQAVKTAEAVYKGGARAIEFCLRTEDAENKFITKEVFDAIRKKCPDIKIGVGTIQRPEDFTIAKNAGADFTVSATYSETLIEEANKQGIPFVPNIKDTQMISDIMLGEGGRKHNFERLREFGITGFKVSALSSSPYASTGNANAALAIMGNRENRFPPDMSIICTEGVFGLNQYNLNNFPFNHPRAAGVGGTWMWQQIGKGGKPFSLIQNGDFESIEKLTGISLKIAKGEQPSQADNMYMDAIGFGTKDHARTKDYAKQTGLIPDGQIARLG